MGTGELGGIYFPALALALSASNVSPRNISILSLAVPASSFAPLLLGALKDHWGFWASLFCAFILALAGLIAVASIKKSALHSISTNQT
jgi:membrane-bound metal-dependent hydrolase YbcI (DUF457 family)